MELFELFPGVKASKHGALHIERLECMTVADLHLGFEGILAERGIFVPKVQFSEVMKKLRDEKEEKTLVILGDVKHEFSETTYHEFAEVRELFSWAKEKFERVYLVRGNHDNFIGPLCKRFGIEFVEELLLDNFFFFHGHREVRVPEKADYLIMGHEHPAVELASGTMREKVKCFLYGRVNGRRLVVLPAYSTLMEGTEINNLPREELLSPFLRSVDVNQLKCLGIDEELSFLELPEVGKLRKI